MKIKTKGIDLSLEANEVAILRAIVKIAIPALNNSLQNKQVNSVCIDAGVPTVADAGAIESFCSRLSEAL